MPSVRACFVAGTLVNSFQKQSFYLQVVSDRIAYKKNFSFTLHLPILEVLHQKTLTKQQRRRAAVLATEPDTLDARNF